MCACAGFWSILVLSVLAGLVCFASSWTLTYLDLYQPGTVFSPMTQAKSRLTHSCTYRRALMGISHFLHNRVDCLCVCTRLETHLVVDSIWDMASPSLTASWAFSRSSGTSLDTLILSSYQSDAGIRY